MFRPCFDHVSSGKERQKRYSGVDFYTQDFLNLKKGKFVRIDVHVSARRAGEDKQKLLWSGLKPSNIFE